MLIFIADSCLEIEMTGFFVCVFIRQATINETDAVMRIRVLFVKKELR